MNDFIGTIILFGGNFAPRGWAFCHGQLLPIASNSTLFSILGTTYGGDGRTTFGLPDFRGRVVIGQGHGPGLQNYRIGQKGGSETNTLTQLNLPAHNHSLHIPMSVSESGEPTGVLGNSGIYAEEASAGAFYPGASTTSIGGSQPINNIEPVLALNYIIALEGTYPSRS